MEDASNTIQILVACAMQGRRFSLMNCLWMRKKNGNGQPNEGVCDICHTVQSDSLFVMRWNNRNGQLDKGVCD